MTQTPIAPRECDGRGGSLFETLALGVAYVNPDGAITAANTAARRILGLTPDHLQGRVPLDVRWRAVREDGSDLPAEEHPALVALRTGREVRDVVVRVQEPGGDGCTWISVTAIPLAREGENPPGEVCICFSDITDRKRVEDALRESEERYQRITEGLTDYLYTVRVENGRAVGTVHSQACEVVTGYTREEFAADPYLWIRMVVPEDRDRVIDHVALILAGRKVPPIEHRITRRDGQMRWVLDTTIPHLDAEGRLISYDGVVNDITEHKEAEDALRLRERQLAEAQQIANLGFYEFDIGTGAWTSSEVLDGIFGIGADFVRDLAGWIDLIHPEERQAVLDYLQSEVWGRRQGFDREYRILRHADGREVWVHGRGVLQLGGDGRPVKMFGTIQDISEHKRADQLHLELERRLLYAQKLESLGVLAGGIAHDFNNLLMAMMGTLEVALLNLGPEAEARPRIEQALQTAWRASELAGQMLAYSGRGLFAARDVDLSKLVLENVHLFRAAVSKAVTLDLRLGKGLPLVRADLAQIQQVMMNLITNAAEAIGDGTGVVTIATAAGDCTQEGLSRSVIEQKPAPGQYVWLEVADTGSGMDEETRERMFDPFFSTKFVGRGLGLSAVHGIVKAHGGAITVQSQVGRGTTIRVLFPVAASVPDAVRTE